MKENEFDGKGPSAQPVIRANKKVRAVAIAIWIVSVLTGAAAIQWLLPYGEQYVSKQEPQAALRTMQIAVCLHLPQRPSAGRLFVLVRIPSGEVASDPPAGDLGHSQYQRWSRAIGPNGAGGSSWLWGCSCLLSACLVPSTSPIAWGRVFQGRPPQPSAESTQPAEAQ